MHYSLAVPQIVQSNEGQFISRLMQRFLALDTLEGLATGSQYTRTTVCLSASVDVISCSSSPLEVVIHLVGTQSTQSDSQKATIAYIAPGLAQISAHIFITSLNGVIFQLCFFYISSCVCVCVCECVKLLASRHSCPSNLRDPNNPGWYTCRSIRGCVS